MCCHLLWWERSLGDFCMFSLYFLLLNSPFLWNEDITRWNMADYVLNFENFDNFFQNFGYIFKTILNRNYSGTCRSNISFLLASLLKKKSLPRSYLQSTYTLKPQFVTLYTKKSTKILSLCHAQWHINQFHVTSHHGHVMAMSWSWIIFPYSPPQNYFVKMPCS